MPFYLTPKQGNVSQELQVCIAEALYDIESISLIRVVIPIRR